MKHPLSWLSFKKHKTERQPAKKWRRTDRWMLAVVVILSVFGILMVYNSSVAIALRDFSDKYHFASEQIRWLALGYLALVLFSYLDYHNWYRLALPMFLFSLVLLLAVFVPGIGVKALGARRWINLGFFVLQPAEVAKLSLIIYLSAWFSFKEKGRLGAFLFLLGMMTFLIILEPDLGTAVIVMLTAAVIYFLSGASIYHFLLLIPVLVVSTGLLAVFSPYRIRRLISFLNPQSDPLGASYQIRQILLALGSGGLFGLGVGQSRQKYEYLPEANTDSIFAIIGEEFGFIGAVLMILLFIFLIWRGFRIAHRSSDKFGQMLALGITSGIGVQTLINLAAMVSLIPLTGVPLPLISYGGSSLVVTLAALGILLNISRHN